MPSKIEVLPYNPKWPELFEKEAHLIKEALGSNCIEIHHIGSTSIPGLPAKPIIDILPVVKEIQKAEESASKMQALGYDVKGEFGIAFRRFFQKGQDVKTHNVHVFEQGNPEISRYLKFRDWMRSHPEDAKNYANLKTELAAKFPEDILQYVMGKDKYVASIDAKDGYDGWRIVQALTDNEWACVRYLRGLYYQPPNSDPCSWPLLDKSHTHLIFYKNAAIIGYIHLQLNEDKTATLLLIVMDPSYRNDGYGSQFLGLCEKWLSHKGVKTFITGPFNDAIGYFEKRGYTKIPGDEERTSKAL